MEPPATARRPDRAKSLTGWRWAAAPRSIRADCAPSARPSSVLDARRRCRHSPNLSYYKVSGWVRFMQGLPVSGSQKIQTFRLFPANQNPREGAIDLRELKARRRER